MEIRMKKKWYFKYNNLKTGFIVGLILPIIGFFIGFLAKGGDSVVNNLQLICKSCNTRKGPLDEDDFKYLMEWVEQLKDETKEYVLRKLAKGGRY